MWPSLSRSGSNCGERTVNVSGHWPFIKLQSPLITCCRADFPKLPFLICSVFFMVMTWQYLLLSQDGLKEYHVYVSAFQVIPKQFAAHEALSLKCHHRCCTGRVAQHMEFLPHGSTDPGLILALAAVILCVSFKFLPLPKDMNFGRQVQTAPHANCSQCKLFPV